jgi:hypothetical protein
MVIRCSGPQARQTGALMTELIVAMALLVAAVLPVAYSFVAEKRYARAAYQHAVAMELVDGEIEVLRAGEWRGYASGTHDYAVGAAAATNLPPGKFLLTVRSNTVRLEWKPTMRERGGPAVMREVRVK